jgi:hypothetical protein
MGAAPALPGAGAARWQAKLTHTVLDRHQVCRIPRSRFSALLASELTDALESHAFEHILSPAKF